MVSWPAARFARTAVCFAALLVSAHAYARDKTDMITMRNGDRITGEIVKLEYGQLQLETDDLGTVAIEWDAIARVDSSYEFDIEQIGGEHLYGVIRSSPDGKSLSVRTRTQTLELEPARVTRIAQLEGTFWSRLNGSFSLGYNFTKSTDSTQLSGHFDVSYRGETVVATLGLDAHSSKTPDAGTLDRNSIGFGYRWLRPHQNFWAGLVNLESNEELGIDTRVQVGGGFGRYLLQTTHSEISAFLGAAVNNERVTGDEEGQQSAEGIIGLGWRIYRLDSPKTNLVSEFFYYPSITESGRYRGGSQVSLRHEIIADFFIDLSLYYDYDSQPPGDAVAKDDYGVTTSLGYSF
jgi:hypothetical protein